MPTGLLTEVLRYDALYTLCLSLLACKKYSLKLLLEL